MVKSIALKHGITLQYAEQGSRTGIPVIFLHGVTDSCRSFEPLFEHLPASIHAIALTQRGHGGSSKPEGGYRYADFAQDLGAFMDAQGLPAAVIVGHSMGSLVAQRFAADHPERVAGLVLMGAFRTMHGDPGIKAFWDASLAMLDDPVDPVIARDFQLSTLAREVAPEFLNMVVKESLAVPARVWQAIFKGFLETPDFSEQLSVLSAPALVAWGDRDSMTSREDQDVLLSRLQRGRLIVYPEAGHAFHWEAPGRFAADLVAFIYRRL
jgi:pimeloyl-ACP methyl ester carboxylesterase